MADSTPGSPYFPWSLARTAFLRRHRPRNVRGVLEAIIPAPIKTGTAVITTMAVEGGGGWAMKSEPGRFGRAKLDWEVPPLRIRPWGRNRTGVYRQVKLSLACFLGARIR